MSFSPNVGNKSAVEKWKEVSKAGKVSEVRKWAKWMYPER